MNYCEKRIKGVNQFVYEEPSGTYVSDKQTPSVSIAELRELNTFVHYYSERTRRYAGQIEQLRERSNQLRMEAGQLLHTQSFNG